MKKKFLACVIASAMLLMGTGYAYWTDAFQLSGTVDTGNLQVKLVNASADSKFSDYLGAFNDNDATFRTSTGTVDKTNINADVSAVDFSLTDMYPGYGQTFTFKADNLGTVAAKLSSIDITGNDVLADNSNKQLLNEIGINLQAKIKDTWYILCPWKNTWVPVAEFKDPVAGTKGADFSIKSKAGWGTSTSYFTKLNGLTNISTSSFDGEFLYLDTQSGPFKFTSDMTIVVSVAMDPDAKGANTSGITSAKTAVSDSLTQNKTQDFTMTFNWDQYDAKPAAK
jgi:hypothetical protein